MTEIKHPEAIAIARWHEAHLWQLADALLADMGKPPKSFAASLRQVTDDFPGYEDDWESWAQLWRVADAFPPETRTANASVASHIKAGNPDVLRIALVSWDMAPRNWDGKRFGRSLTPHIKLAKSAIRMQAKEEAAEEQAK